jgi:nuclease S1
MAVRRGLMLAILSLCVTTGQALGWGGDGHRTVAAIAMKLLPPQKAAALDKLLRESNVGRSFVDSASYADEVLRGISNSFGPWHFVDWRDGTQAYDPSACTPTCIIDQLPKQIDAARTATSNDDKALALSWIIHLIGDLHQPLHVSDRGDHGGNNFPVTYRGKQLCAHGSQDRHPVRVELHSAWDSCLVYDLEGNRTRDQLADDLRGGLTTYRGHPAATGDYMEWAKETHQLAHDVAYGTLNHGDDLGDSYITTALPVVQQQLLKAGVRLAKIIDENL